VNVHVLIQARIESTRLPGKVRRKLNGKSLLRHVCERALCAGFPVTVTHPAGDDFEWANEWLPPECRFPYNGPEDDLVGRLFAAADPSAEVVVRLTADCPLVPVSGIKACVDAIRAGADYAETRSDPSRRPNGIDVQAFTSDVLYEAFKLEDESVREHVTPALLSVMNAKFSRIDKLENIALDGLPPWRLTVDTAQDLERLRLWKDSGLFIDPPHPTFLELTDFLSTRPDLEYFGE